MEPRRIWRPLVAEMAGATLTIELCGKLADPLGRTLALPIPAEGMTVAALLTALHEAHAPLRDLLAHNRIRACVNEVIVGPDALVSVGDNVALFPPVSGG